MHESGMMKDLMRRIAQVVEARNGKRAVQVKVSIGILTQMSPEHFRGHFEEASSGTVAEDALLDIDVVESMSDNRALEVTLESVEVEV